MFNGSACEGNACAAFVDGGSIFVWKLRKEDKICAAFVDGGSIFEWKPRKEDKICA